MEQIACVPVYVSYFPCCTRKSNALDCLIRYLLGTNVNKLFFQVPRLEFGHGPGARVPGGDLVLWHESGHRVPVCTQYLLVLWQSPPPPPP